MKMQNNETLFDSQMTQMFREAAEQVSAPEHMWNEIEDRLLSEPVARKKPSLPKRILPLMAALLILLLGTVTAAHVRITSTRGYTNAEPDSSNFEDLEEIARKAGFAHITFVETFSNGFTFQQVRTSTNREYDADGQGVGESYQSLRVEYEKDGKQLSLSVYPHPDLQINPRSVLETYDWEGITVYKTIYIHFDMPRDWQEKITEEQQRLLDEKIAGGGYDHREGEIIQYDIISFHWVQNGYEYLLSGPLESEAATPEEMETAARETVEANQ